MSVSELHVYDSCNCLFFSLGRNAMYAGCRLIGIGEHTEILTPAFDCDSALQPFKALGAKLVFYRSNPYDFSVDLEDLKKKITPSTGLIHVINHFGMPQSWDEIIALRKETGIPVLEDNAYSLFSRLNDSDFGTFGDVSIFSLRKNLPLRDGGMLRVNNERFKSALELRKKPRRTAMSGFCVSDGFFWKRFFLYKYARMLKHALPGFFPLVPPPPLFSEAGKDPPNWPMRDIAGKEFSGDYLKGISEYSLRKLKCISERDYEETALKKRSAYLFLSDSLSNIRGLRVLWPVLPKGIVPFCLNVLIDNKRDEFLGFLKRRYDVMAWPTLPGAVIEQIKNFPDVQMLGRRILQINLSFDLVRAGWASGYLKSLVRDIKGLADKYL